MLAFQLAQNSPIRTGNPVLDAVLNLGAYGLIGGVAYLLARYFYQGREKDRVESAKALADAHLKREQDFEDLKASWEKERSELYRFRDLSRQEWEKEREELITQRNKAEEQAADARKTAERAADGVKSFMEIAQKEAMGALKESQSALGEAATQARVQSERISALERELDLTRRLNQQQRGVGE